MTITGTAPIPGRSATGLPEARAVGGGAAGARNGAAGNGAEGNTGAGNAGARNALRSRLRLRWELCAGRTTLLECRAEGQLVARQTGPGEVRLLGQAAGPLNGDDTEIELRVGAGCRVLVRSSAATIALPSPDGGGAARVRLAAVVGESAAVGWVPEPVVAAGSSELELESCWETAEGAELLLREQLVLGRHGERGGDIRSRLLIRRDGRDLLSQSLDTTILDRSGRFAGVVERVIASEVRVGARAGEGPAAATSGRGVAMRPEPGLLVASGCGPTVAEAESQLADALSAGDAVVWE